MYEKYWIPGIPNEIENDRLYAVLCQRTSGYAVGDVIRGEDCNWRSVTIIGHYPLPMTMTATHSRRLQRDGSFNWAGIEPTEFSEPSPMESKFAEWWDKEWMGEPNETVRRIASYAFSAGQMSNPTQENNHEVDLWKMVLDLRGELEATRRDKEILKTMFEYVKKNYVIVVEDARDCRKKMSYAKAELIVRGIKLDNDCVPCPCPDVLLEIDVDDEEIDRVNRMSTRELLNCSAFG